MEVFGVGPSELVFIILIAIIILGPKDMQKAGKTIGRFLNQLVRSDGWKVFQKTSAEIRELPRTLMREANVEMAETEKAVQQMLDPRLQSPASTPPGSNPTPPPSTPAESASQAESEPPIIEPPQDSTDKHD